MYFILFNFLYFVFCSFILLVFILFYVDCGFVLFIHIFLFYSDILYIILVYFIFYTSIPISDSIDTDTTIVWLWFLLCCAVDRNLYFCVGRRRHTSKKINAISTEYEKKREKENIWFQFLPTQQNKMFSIYFSVFLFSIEIKSTYCDNNND